MSRPSRAQFVLALVAVVTVGIAFRSIPLWYSPLPFNPDGIIHARNAKIAAQTGHLPLSDIFTDDLTFGSFLAVVSLVTDSRPLTVSQPVIAIVGTLPAVVAAMFARRWTHSFDGSRRRARRAGVLSGSLVAIGGIYLYRSAPVDEQTLGLLLVPLALAAVVTGLWHDDRRWLVVAVPLLLAIPPLHNLESVLVGLSLTALVGFALLRAGQRRRLLVGASVLAVGYWLYNTGYTLGVTELTATTVHQQDRVTKAPGLVVAWVILGVAGIAWFERVGKRTKRAVLFVPFLVFFGVICLNAIVPVFPGLPETPLALLAPALALVIPAVVACWGYPVVGRDIETRALMTTLLAGPLMLLGFSLTTELSPVYFATATRTQWFLYVPVLAVVGVTVTWLGRDRLAGRSWTHRSLVIVVVLAVGIGVPVAFAGLPVFSYQGITTTGEFAASTFAHEHVPGTWTSDDHLVRITRYHSPTVSGTVAPVYSWVHDASAPPPNCPTIVKASWTTAGAQFYPRPPATIAPDRLAEIDTSGHRIYHGGSTQSIRTFHPTDGDVSACSGAAEPEQ